MSKASKDTPAVINPHSKININLNALTTQNKHQFAAEGENDLNSHAQGRKFNNRPSDDYGRGAPTDRLTFGYAPSVPVEAVAFHSQYTAKQWKLERRLKFKKRCLRSRAVYFQEIAALANGTVKKEKVLNFEPETSAIKLRLYWIEKMEEEKKMLNGGDGNDIVVDATKNSKSGASNVSGSDNKKDSSGKGSSGKKDGNFGQLLSDMFGGDYSAPANEAGKRRQREQ